MFWRGCDSTGDAKNEAEVKGRTKQAHIHQWLSVCDVACIKALHLWNHSDCFHSRQCSLNVLKWVGKDLIEVEFFMFCTVNCVIHTAHIQGSNFRANCL